MHPAAGRLQPRPVSLTQLFPARLAPPTSSQSTCSPFPWDAPRFPPLHARLRQAFRRTLQIKWGAECSLSPQTSLPLGPLLLPAGPADGVHGGRPSLPGLLQPRPGLTRASWSLAQTWPSATVIQSCWGHAVKATGAGTEGLVPACTVQVTAPGAWTCSLRIVSFEEVNTAHWNLTSRL